MKWIATNFEDEKLAVPSLPGREFSSAGLEHLPYKQRVGGSNPSTPTNEQSNEMSNNRHLFVFIRLGANLFICGVANPSTPTKLRPLSTSGLVYLL